MDTKETRHVLDELMQTLKDGDEGYTKAAEELSKSTRPDLSAHFIACAKQRRDFHNELSGITADLGGEPSEKGTVIGTLHRGWMAVKDAMSGDDPESVLKAAEKGEEHAVAQYEEACKADLSTDVRTIVERQFRDVKAAKAKLTMLAEAA